MSDFKAARIAPGSALAHHGAAPAGIKGGKPFEVRMFKGEVLVRRNGSLLLRYFQNTALYYAHGSIRRAFRRACADAMPYVCPYEIHDGDDQKSQNKRVQAMEPRLQTRILVPLLAQPHADIGKREAPRP